MFSVIMPCYGMGKYIGEALESVDAQTHDGWEVLTVDDCGPEDGTAGIVEEFAKKHPQHRVDFIRHETNTGVSGARNTAIEAAHGEYLAFLDPDDFWLPDYLKRVGREFANNPGIDVVASPVEAFEAGVDGVEVIDRMRFEQWQIRQFPASLAVGNFIQPSAAVVRKQIVRELGGFDTDPEIQHIEDYDLWIRLCERGCRFHFVNENLTRYRKHPAAATSDIRRMAGLHEHLAGKHAPFFIASQSEVIRRLLRDLNRTREALRNPLQYALMRLINRAE